MDKNLKNRLDELVKKYETSDFINDDPVQFPHLFKNKRDQEVSGFIASCFAYGKREKIIETVGYIHKIMEYKPYDFCLNYDIDNDFKKFNGFSYRYNGQNDINLLMHIIGCALKEYESLENIFLKDYSINSNNIKQTLTSFVKVLYGYIPHYTESTKGIRHLIPNPENGSACKRLNLFLKWMVRKGSVDLNIWKNVSTSDLIIPLDTHVARVSRNIGLTERKADDWITASQITEKLKKFDPKDPAKYDFAIFGAGIAREL
jgi:uncharacterized protein (TIGR02757 family)